MLRNKPKLTYSGLTIVLSNPSRFDTTRLLSANAGVMFNDHCLRPEMNIMQCDVRLADDPSPFLDDTKCILLAGEYAMHKLVPSSGNNSLNEMRGSVLQVNGMPAIATYFPQDACDIKSYEQQINKESKEYSGEDEHENEDSDDTGEKSHSPTKRSNYAFWIKQDVKKCKYILSNGVPLHKEPTYKIYSSSQEVIDALLSTKNGYLWFDMETDYEEQNLLCFAFSFDGITIYSVPVLNYFYRSSYSNLHLILSALSVAIRDNTIVAHNGASFDFWVLATKYNIPVVKCYDTMIAQQRCFPDIEKSLGHCISLWTWESFHKDTDSGAYLTQEHMMAKLRYCVKDVYTMILVHRAITDYSKTIPGLIDSIKCAQDSIRPYLITSIQGIRYNEQKVIDLMKENDRLMMQYMRIIKLLIGESGMELVRKVVKGKAKAFPGSNSQCCEYFHNLLGYSVVSRSPKTGKPSLAKKALFKLALKYPDNPVITFCLMYRTIAKEYSTLKFKPWKDNDDNIIKKSDDSEDKENGGHRITLSSSIKAIFAKCG